MKPKNYSTLRAILKEEQGKKITPYIFKMADTSQVCNYLEQKKKLILKSTGKKS